jgi:hypothetical protein
VMALLSGLVAIVLRDLDRRLSSLEKKQETGDSAQKLLSEATVKLTVQVESLQKALEQRTSSGLFHALHADGSGSHKVGP